MYFFNFQADKKYIPYSIVTQFSDKSLERLAVF